MTGSRPRVLIAVAVLVLGVRGAKGTRLAADQLLAPGGPQTLPRRAVT